MNMHILLSQLYVYTCSEYIQKHSPLVKCYATSRTGNKASKIHPKKKAGGQLPVSREGEDD